MQAITVEGTTLHVADNGPEDGPALVFSNSLGTDLRVWDRLVPLLPTGLRLIRYDKRGHGLSGSAPAPYVISDHVADLAGILDALGVECAVVCGLSVGGMIAQGLAAERPDLVRALVLCDTGAKIGSPQMWDDRIAAVDAGGIAALAEPILERWFTVTFRKERPDDLALWRNMLTRTPVEGYLGTCAAIRDADLEAEARAIRVPTLCVVGDQDTATPPELVHRTAGLIPGARFEIIDDAGHLPCVEQPDALAVLIIEFLRETGHV